MSRFLMGRGGRSISIAIAAAAAAFALGYLADEREAHASPEDLFGYGTRTSAMGATGVAHAHGYETAWHNPALASTIRTNRLTLGYGGAVYGLQAVGAGMPGAVSTQPARGFFIGADLPIPFGGALRDRVGISLAFYTPSDVIVRGRVLYPEKTQFPLLGDRSQSLTIRAGLGVDIGWGIKAGIGVAALAEIVGTVVAATDVTGRVGTSVENQLVATYAPIFGLTYDLPGKFRAGLVYRGELDARFTVIVDGSKLSSLTIPLFNISGLAQYDPAQAALEIARIDNDVLNTLALQVVFKKWSDFPGVLEPTVVCSEGGAGACGLVPPTIPWRDTFVVRLGAEQGFELAPGVVLRGRGGAFLETSALPSELPGSEAFDVPSKSVVSVPTRYFDNTRIAVTTGFGLTLADPSLGPHRQRSRAAKAHLPPIDIDFFAQYHVLLPRTVTSTDPRTNAVFSSGESSGHVKVFGLTAGVRF